MALPSKVNFVTFDVYGTLIDWETGVYDAFEKEAARDGFTIDDRTRSSPSSTRYAARDRGRLLRALRRGPAPRRRSRSPRTSTGRWSPRAPASCPTPSRAGRPSRRPTRSSTKFAKKFQTGLISNIDDKLLGQTRRHIAARLRPRRHRPAGALLQARSRRTSRSARGGSARKKGWVHIASSYYHDVEPCLKEKVPVDLGQPQRKETRAGQKKPTAEVKTLLEAAKLLGARRPSASCASSRLHADVLVADLAGVADDAARSCAAARRRSSIDSPVFPTSSRRCRRVLEQAGFPVSGLLATHGDWDHVLGRLAFPGAALGVAETTAARLTGEPGRRPARAARVRRGALRRARAPLSLGQVQALPVPGHARAGRARARAASDRRPHRRRHGGLGAVGARARLRRLPLAGRDPDALADGLARRLSRDARAPAPARDEAEWVVPGHGAAIDGARALAILRRGRALPGATGSCRSRGALRCSARSTPRTAGGPAKLPEEGS